MLHLKSYVVKTVILFGSKHEISHISWIWQPENSRTSPWDVQITISTPEPRIKKEKTWTVKKKLFCPKNEGSGFMWHVGKFVPHYITWSVNLHSTSWTANLTIYTLISTTSKHMTYLFVSLPTLLVSFNGPCTPSRGKFYINKPTCEIKLIYILNSAELTQQNPSLAADRQPFR